MKTMKTDYVSPEMVAIELQSEGVIMGDSQIVGGGTTGGGLDDEE